ncbi:Nucleic acid binding and Aminoacyl-tRNA synthetase domain containing protein [Mesorhizobium loti]|nr:Nucleic acid binding and Aminoacyl-tRNA synthetase domain containing protein [Mesorhizobium loti]
MLIKLFVLGGSEVKKYEKPRLVKAARLQALAAQQVSSQPPVDNGSDNSGGNNEGGSIV